MRGHGDATVHIIGLRIALDWSNAPRGPRSVAGRHGTLDDNSYQIAAFGVVGLTRGGVDEDHEAIVEEGDGQCPVVQSLVGKRHVEGYEERSAGRDGSSL